MKREPKLITIHRTSAFQLDPTFTSKESIVLRALAARRTDRQVCNELRMDPATFLRMMRDMREKIGTADRGALGQVQGCSAATTESIPRGILLLPQFVQSHEPVNLVSNSK